MERDTRQRAAIRSVIEHSERPLSPPEVLALAQAHVPQMSLATVYRNLKSMQGEGLISPVWLPGESARFESKHLGHHHHFRCNGCEQVFDIHSCAGEALHTVPNGFVVERHELTLYGLCPECAPTKHEARGRLGAIRPAAAHAQCHTQASSDATEHQRPTTAKTRTRKQD